MITVKRFLLTESLYSSFCYCFLETLSDLKCFNYVDRCTTEEEQERNLFNESTNLYQYVARCHSDSI